MGEVAAYRREELEAQRNLDGVRELLRMGSSSALEVSLAIGDLSDARLALLDAEIRHQVALIQLAQATGTAPGPAGGGGPAGPSGGVGPPRALMCSLPGGGPASTPLGFRDSTRSGPGV